MVYVLRKIDLESTTDPDLTSSSPGSFSGSSIDLNLCLSPTSSLSSLSSSIDSDIYNGSDTFDFSGTPAVGLDPAQMAVPEPEQLVFKLSTKEHTYAHASTKMQFLLVL